MQYASDNRKIQNKIIKMIENGDITAGHGKALLRIEDKEKQLEVAMRIVEEGLSVRTVENIAKKIIENKEKRKIEKKEKDIYIIDAEEKLSNIFGAKVNISMNNKKGKIEISYNNEDELNDILSMIMEEN